MSRKINPKLFRLGITKQWDSRWFPKKKTLPKILEEDFKIREFLKKKLKPAGIENIIIERLGNELSINITTARPGVIIGRGGKGIDDLTKEVDSLINKHRKTVGLAEKVVLSINISEVKSPTASAQVVANLIAEDLEKRTPFRKVMKRMIDQVSKNKEVEGVKIRVSGRLGGADIARSEHLEWGKMPLQTLRADIDFAMARAIDTYGSLGIKVWIYKGQVFEEDKSDINKGLGEILRPRSDI